MLPRMGDISWTWWAVCAVVVLALLWGSRRPRPRVGEVWFAQVPFEDGTGSKDRPVLVLSVSGRTCEVARFTSQNRDARRDHERVPVGVTGLPKGSWINLRPTTLRRSAFRRRTGKPGKAYVAWYREAAVTR
ncbi:PemK-like, MazF-like toxin of type II toxin-antitoxin system [Cellulomonas sp. PhB150]|nr:PemK-like, MazF-like toxin of type II toxin-antitoxin system [Cellulomonas sp. PhB150]